MIPRIRQRWGTGFIDIDQDGWMDIFMVNGHIYPEVDQHKSGPLLSPGSAGLHESA